VSPYIVTTKRRCDQPACDRSEPCSAERSGWCAHPNSDDGDGNRTPVSRRAVATLEEAREEARDRLRENRSLYGDSNEYRRFGEMIPALPEQGGAVGPLPDGTVIEVEQVGWSELARLAGRTRYTVPPDEPVDPDGLGRKGWQVILDTYNARQT
jgi:hypothetical protein